MNRSDLLLNVIQLIKNQGYQCALVGGLAVGTWTRERFTDDVDFAVAVGNDKEAEKPALVFQQRGYVLEQLLEHKTKRVIATLRFSFGGSSIESPELDLLVQSCGIEREIASAAELIEVLPSAVVPVASVGHLIAMKLLAENESRPNDRSDLLMLKAVASKADLKIAQESVRLIEKRGFARGKNLMKALGALSES